MCRRRHESQLAWLLIAQLGCLAQPPPVDVASPGDAGGHGDEAPSADPPPELPLTVLDLLGVFEVRGEDATWGFYTGRGEVRPGATTGAYRVIRAVDWETATFEGQPIAEVWEGRVVATTAPLVIEADLRTVGFIRAYDGMTRDPAAAKTTLLRGEVRRGAGGLVAVRYANAATPTVTVAEEVWRLTDPLAAEPIWANLRQVVPAHDPPPETVKGPAFQAFQSFHALPDVAPYVARPEFEAAIHSFTVDPTDFDYYQANPNRVRVIQGVVDPIALAEARLRARAYSFRLYEKARIFEAEMPIMHVNEAGMYVDWVQPAGGAGSFLPSGDSLLWTGVYVASQTLRFLDTAEPEALANVQRSLDAQILCYDIAGVPGQFARTLRAHAEPVSDGWVRGLPPYDRWDWLSGGNNDMMRGLSVGFLWGTLALRAAGGDPVRLGHIERITRELLATSPIAADHEVNETAWTFFLYFLTGDLDARLRYEALFPVVEPFLIDMGNGVRYDFGTTLDASGGHLNLQTLLDCYVIASTLGHDHAARYRSGLRRALEIMRRTRLGLLQLVTATLGDFAAPPPELDEALWVMREYPVPKADFDIDHRLDPAFCMSPYPELPWKLDWETSNRTQSLVAYPLFERNVDTSYQWKANPMRYWGATTPVAGGKADFLFAYWFGRHFGVITPTM